MKEVRKGISGLSDALGLVELASPWWAPYDGGMRVPHYRRLEIEREEGGI